MIHSYTECLAAAAERWRKRRNVGKIVPKGKHEAVVRNEREDSGRACETMQSLVTPLMHLRTLRILLNIRRKTN